MQLQYSGFTDDNEVLITKQSVANKKDIINNKKKQFKTSIMHSALVLVYTNSTIISRIGLG